MVGALFLIVVYLTVQLILSLVVGFTSAKENVQISAAKILGSVSALMHFIFLTRILSVVLLVITLVELLIAIFTTKSKVCCIALIIVGVLTLSLFDIIGGIFAFAEHCRVGKIKNESTDITIAEELSEQDGTANELIDSTQENTKDGERPATEEYSGKPLPVLNEQWFTDRGVALIRTPMRKRDMRSLSGEEKQMICFTTFPSVLRALICTSVFIGAVLVVALVAFLVGWLSSGQVERGLIYLAVVLVVSLFGGSFIVNSWSRILDGFHEIGGIWVIKLSPGYIIWLHIITGIALLWGYFSTMIFMLLDMGNQAKVRSLPLVVVPTGLGFDDMIAYYAEYERECIERDIKNKKREAVRENYEEGVKNYEEAVKDNQNNSSLNYIEKAEQQNELDKEKLKLDKAYEEAKKKIE